MKKEGKQRDGEKLCQIWIKPSTKKQLEHRQIDDGSKTHDEIILKLLKNKK